MMVREPLYLDDFADEVSPEMLESHTLDGWAKWLAGGGERANPDVDPEEDNCWVFDPPFDGTEYEASSIVFEDDIIATRSADGESISFSRPIPADIDFIAVRFGPNLGWDADAILDPTCSYGGSIEHQLVEHMMLERGEACDLAVGRTKTFRVRYLAGPPPGLEPLQSTTLERAS